MNYDFPNHVNGDTFDGVKFAITVNGSPLDLTGASVEMNMYVADGERPVIFSTNNGKLTITDPPTSGLLEFNRQVVSVPTLATYFYQMVYTLRDGTVKTYLEGNWTIKKV
jgi:hypothetical protein